MPSRKPPPDAKPDARGLHLAGRTGPDANATKPAKKKHSARQVFMATEAEEARYIKAARKSRVPLSRWIRDTLNTAAKS